MNKKAVSWFVTIPIILIFIVVIIVGVFTLAYKKGSLNEVNKITANVVKGSGNNVNYNGEKENLLGINKKQCNIIIEKRTEIEPIAKKVDLLYKINGPTILGRNYNGDAIRNVIENIDSVGGEFQIKFKVFYNDGGTEEGFFPSRYIKPGEKGYFDKIFQYNRIFTENDIKITVIAPKKTELVNTKVIREYPKEICE